MPFDFTKMPSGKSSSRFDFTKMPEGFGVPELEPTLLQKIVAALGGIVGKAKTTAPELSFAEQLGGGPVTYTPTPAPTPEVSPLDALANLARQKPVQDVISALKPAYTPTELTSGVMATLGTMTRQKPEGVARLAALPKVAEESFKAGLDITGTYQPTVTAPPLLKDGRINWEALPENVVAEIFRWIGRTPYIEAMGAVLGPLVSQAIPKGATPVEQTLGGLLLRGTGYGLTEAAARKMKPAEAVQHAAVMGLWFTAGGAAQIGLDKLDSYINRWLKGTKITPYDAAKVWEDNGYAVREGSEEYNRLLNEGWQLIEREGKIPILRRVIPGVREDIRFVTQIVGGRPTLNVTEAAAPTEKAPAPETTVPAKVEVPPAPKPEPAVTPVAPVAPAAKPPQPVAKEEAIPKTPREFRIGDYIKGGPFEGEVIGETKVGDWPAYKVRTPQGKELGIVKRIAVPAERPAQPQAKEPLFVVDSDYGIAKVVRWTEDDNPIVTYPGKTGGRVPGPAIQGGNVPYTYELKAGQWREATAQDFSKAIKPSKSERMIDLRRWRDEYAQQVRREAAPQMKATLDAAAKERRRSVLQARLARGESIGSPKLLEEFRGEEWAEKALAKIVPTEPTKPYIGLQPGTPQWMDVWRAHPELQGEMLEYQKGLEKKAEPTKTVEAEEPAKVIFDTKLATYSGRKQLTARLGDFSGPQLVIQQEDKGSKLWRIINEFTKEGNYYAKESEVIEGGLTLQEAKAKVKELFGRIDHVELSGKIVFKPQPESTLPPQRRYWISIRGEEGKETFREVAGKPIRSKVKGFEDVDLFIHRTPDNVGWTITEARTGLALAWGKSQKEVVENLEKNLTTRIGTRAKLEELVSGKPVSPRYSAAKPEATKAVEAELGAEVNKVFEEVSPPVGLSVKITTKVPSTPKGEFEFGDPNIEARYRAAHGVQGENFWQQVREIATAIRNKATREFEHLPRTAEFSPLRYKLLELSKQKGIAGDRTVRLQQGLIAQFINDPARFNLFERKVLLDDLAEEMEAGHDLPFGFTKETLPKEVERLNQEIAKHPEIAEALQKRNKVWDAIKNDYIKAMKGIGFDVSERFAKKNYFRHQVLEYANARAIAGTGQKVKTPTGRGFLKQRRGSTYDINTNYLQAEFEVMAQMLYDIELAKVIRLVDKQYNIVDRLKREAARLNMERLREMGERDETIDARLKAFRQQIAIGMDRLGKLAEQGKLSAGEKGEFEDVIERIIEDRERMAEAAEEDMPMGTATGTPGVPMSEEGRRFFAFLSWLLKQDTEGTPAAGQILKAVSHRREFIRETLGDKFLTYEDIIPDGYETWQPREGNVFYMAESVPAQLAEKLLEGQADQIGLKAEDLRKVLAMGGKRKEFVVKSEVAQTLDSFGKKPADNIVTMRARQIMGGWKQYQLISPKRVVKYNLRNLSGDADAVFVGNPSAFKKVGQAAHELYQVFYGDRAMTPTMKDWFERGGMQSTLQVAELGDINELKIFSDLFKQNKPITKKMWDGYIRRARQATEFREAILRYAAYLDYLEQMQKNPKGRPNNFGASIPEEIMALPDIKDRAFVLANQLLGAYDQVSALGQTIRTYLAPFWSWQEVNAKRWLQLVKNAASDCKTAEAVGRSVMGGIRRSPLIALRLGAFILKASALWAMLTAYNNLRFPNEERDLPEDVRNRPHIVLGRDKDGNVRYFDRLGMLGEFLEWFGMDAPAHLVADYLNGRKTIKDIVTEVPKGFFNKAWQSLGPHIKAPVEVLLGKKTYPDVFKPGTIRDKWLYLAESVGLGDEYRLVTKMPSRPYSESLRNIIESKADPGESSYYDILDEKNEYMRKIGKGSEYGGATNPRSKALYNLKMAVRYGDKAAFQKYLMEYVAAGGSEQGYEASIRSMDPLYGLTASEKKDFKTKWLDDEGRRKLEQAEAFYKTVIEKGEKIPGATKEIRRALPAKPKR